MKRMHCTQRTVPSLGRTAHRCLRLAFCAVLAAQLAACGSDGNDDAPLPLGAAALTEPATFRCGGQPLSAVPTDEGLALMLLMPGRTLLMMPVLSPSGARYAGEAGEFGIEDDGSAWLRAYGGERVACEPQPAAGERNGSVVR